MNFQTNNYFRSTYLVGFFVLILSSVITFLPASASEALMKKYQTLMESQGFSFTYGNLETHSDNSFTVHDINLVRHGVEDPLKIKAIKMDGVTELSGIGLSADSLNMSGLSWDGKNKQGQEVVVTVSDGAMNGFYLPDPKDLEAPLFVFDKYSIEINNTSVTIDGNTIVELPNVNSVFNGNSGRKKFDGFMKVTGLAINPEHAGDGGKMKQQLAVLGYDKLVMDINLDADWDMETGDLNLSKYEFDLKDMGALDMQFAIGGYTEEFAKKFRAINAEIQALPAEEQAKASQRIMGELAALTVKSMKLSFRDSSITEKVLNLQSQASGQPVENMKAMVPIMLDGAMASLGQPELTAKLVGAVQGFLAQPGTIFVEAKPAEPLSFSDVMGLGMSMPNILIEKLNIEAGNQ